MEYKKGTGNGIHRNLVFMYSTCQTFSGNMAQQVGVYICLYRFFVVVLYLFYTHVIKKCVM